jgi:hypothetical protein
MKSLDFHRKAYVCSHVLAGESPVLLVDRSYGDWCLLCGEPHEQDADNFHVVGIGHIVASDPTLEAVLDLRSDWEAERSSVEADWVRRAVAENQDREDVEDVRARVISAMKKLPN